MVQVEKYQIRHEGEEYFLEPEALHEGSFVVKLKEKGAKIEARMKYQGYHNWTRWISSEEKVNTALLYLTRDMLSLLPVLVNFLFIVVAFRQFPFAPWHHRYVSLTMLVFQVINL